ncbi:hypothetical protein DKM44_02150 [Deinococcus irradiatisoli]|uniref:Helix-turn-helix domain-containing protein n=1 Tax=Deinococcus irradiatisoli TaxID=2202254 RepID=A0A2Z3JFC3_9DEIO|nr:helix-turn-helix domain-containing protein [Deinococcus irradiatisoli]AWN22181.1 hypothetical protein DKM44_02150 [Deinococcus irradiatisoli]
MSTIIVTDAETLRALIAEELTKALASLPQTASAPVAAEEYLTVPEVAAQLKVSEQHIYRQIRDGELTAHRSGRKLRVPVSSLSAALAVAQ